MQQHTDYVSTLRAAAAANPEEWLRPITTEQAAEALGLPSKNALQKIRARAKQIGDPTAAPPGLAFVIGLGWRYRSKLDVLIWAHEQHERAELDPSAMEAEGGEA